MKSFRSDAARNAPMPFALFDFIKERAVNGRSTTILDWRYSREEYDIH